MAERWTPAYDRLFSPDHELADDTACQRWAFLDLCHLAQYKDGVRIVGGTVIQLPRGCFLASLRFLAVRWNWSKTRVDRFLKALQDPGVGKLEVFSTNANGTVYRLVNYNTYANPRDSNEDANRDSNEDGDGTEMGQITTSTSGNTMYKETAAEVGRFLETVGSKWKLKQGINDWAVQIEGEAQYAGIDIPQAIRECAEYWQARRGTPQPDRAIRNWLSKAKEISQRNGTTRDTPSPPAMNSVQWKRYTELRTEYAELYPERDPEEYAADLMAQARSET
jgi:hypothetical protein